MTCSPRSGSCAWGGSDRTVDVHLSWLRRKLGETAARPRYLHSVRGVGVRLVAPTETSAGADDSVRRRIMLLAAGLTVLIVLAFAVPLAILIRNTVYQRATDALQEQANRVANYLRGTASAPSVDAIAGYVGSGRGPVVRQCRVAGSDQRRLHAAGCDGAARPGRIRRRGRSRSRHPAAAAGCRLARRQARDAAGAARTRPARQRAGCRRGPRVRLDAQLRSDETRWWLLLGFGSVGLLAIGILAAELLTRRLVRPLTDTAETAHRISAGDVTARAPTEVPARSPRWARR